MKHLLLASAIALLPFGAQAASVITNGSVSLGVNDLAQLNFGGVGLLHNSTGNEATIHGCECEGWGVGIDETGQSGYANDATGTANLSLVSFVSDGVSATSVVTVNGTDLRVTHLFTPATETSNLYRVSVKIENTGSTDISDLRYTRTFDWDVDPTPFSEYVTIQGVASTPSVLFASANGFEDSNPFASRSLSGYALGDFVDAGPTDHGSNFDFGFGALLAGEAYEFDIFYGAARTEAGILASLGEVGAELYSLGQSDGDPLGLGTDSLGRETSTFAFGFSGVGGSIIVPDPTPGGPAPIPLPASGLLLMGAIGLLGARRKLKKA